MLFTAGTAIAEDEGAYKLHYIQAGRARQESEGKTVRQ